MFVTRMILFLAFASIAFSCKSVSKSAVSSDFQASCERSNSDPDQDGWGFENGKSCKMPSTAGKPEEMNDKDVYDQELRVLKAETPLQLTDAFLFGDFGYKDGCPSEIFARKGAMNSEERKAEKTPPGTSDSAAHRFLMRLGQQIFQQALLAKISGETVYAENVVSILRKLSAAKTKFKNSSYSPEDTNDNRYLELGWFLAISTRGVHILDSSMGAEWKQKSGWSETLAAFNTWLGQSIDQNWAMADAAKQTPLNLVSQSGTMNWVGSIDTQYGATNRTFSMLEALFNIAEMRGGNLGPMKLKLNIPQSKAKFTVEQSGTIENIWPLFKLYLRYYFNKPLSQNPKEFVLNYDSKRILINSDPDLPNEEDCGDPLKLNYQAKCLLNKDAYRNDTYHPQMGLASVLHIIKLGRRTGNTLSEGEQAAVIKGLRWACFNNVDGVTGTGAHGIGVWELAFQLFKADELGPYCKRELVANRAKDSNKRASLAWGYSALIKD